MPPELTLTEGFGGCRGCCSAGQDRAGAVPPLTPQPKCSPEGEEAKAGARQAGSIQKRRKGLPPARLAASAPQGQECGDSCPAQGGFVRDHLRLTLPQAMAWECHLALQAQPQDLSSSFEGSKSTQMLPPDPFFWDRQRASTLGSMQLRAAPVQSPRKTIHPAGARQMVCGRCAVWSSVTAL